MKKVLPLYLFAFVDTSLVARLVNLVFFLTSELSLSVAVYIPAIFVVFTVSFFATQRYDISHVENVEQLLTQFLMTGCGKHPCTVEKTSRG